MTREKSSTRGQWLTKGKKLCFGLRFPGQQVKAAEQTEVGKREQCPEHMTVFKS